MNQSLSEIKYGFEGWLEEGAVWDSAHRREILNVCELELPYFVREKIDDQFALIRPDYIDKGEEWNPEVDDFEVALEGFTQYDIGDGKNLFRTSPSL